MINMPSQGFRTVLLLVIEIWPCLLTAQELTSTLHSTFYGVKFAYTGENVTFTCVTSGSSVIAWSSNEYIGSDGLRLEFASIEPVGLTRSVLGGGTVAQLINSTYEDGRVTLVSQLHVLVQSTYQISSITCHNIVMGTTNTTSFQMADDASVTCDKRAVCSGETVMCTCTTGHSSIVAWSSDQLIGKGGSRLEFASVQPVLTTQNASGSNTFAILVDNSDVNGVVVLESELTFIASGNTTNIIILTCWNVIRQISHSTIIPIISRNCEAPSTTKFTSSTTDLIVSTTELNSVTHHGSPRIGNYILAGVIGSVLATFIILGFIPCMVIVLKTRRAKRDQQLHIHTCILQGMEQHSRTEERTCLNDYHDKEPEPKQNDEHNVIEYRRHELEEENKEIEYPRKELEEKNKEMEYRKKELEEEMEYRRKELEKMEYRRKELEEKIEEMEYRRKELEKMEYRRKELEKKIEEMECRREDLELTLEKLQGKEMEYQRKILEEKNGEIAELEIKVQSLSISLIERDRQIEDYQKRENEMVAHRETDSEELMKDISVLSSGLQDNVDILKDELGNRDLTMACMKSDFEDFTKDIFKQHKLTKSGYSDLKNTQKSWQV